LAYDKLVCAGVVVAAAVVIVVVCDWIVAVGHPNHRFDRDVFVPDSDVALVGTPWTEKTHLEGSLLGNQGGAIVGEWFELGDGESCTANLRKE